MRRLRDDLRAEDVLALLGPAAKTIELFPSDGVESRVYPRETLLGSKPIGVDPIVDFDGRGMVIGWRRSSGPV